MSADRRFSGETIRWKKCNLEMRQTVQFIVWANGEYRCSHSNRTAKPPQRIILQTTFHSSHISKSANCWCFLSPPLWNANEPISVFLDQKSNAFRWQCGYLTPYLCMQNQNRISVIACLVRMLCGAWSSDEFIIWPRTAVCHAMAPSAAH